MQIWYIVGILRLQPVDHTQPMNSFHLAHNMLELHKGWDLCTCNYDMA